MKTKPERANFSDLLAQLRALAKRDDWFEHAAREISAFSPFCFTEGGGFRIKTEASLCALKDMIKSSKEHSTKDQASRLMLLSFGNAEFTKRVLSRLIEHGQQAEPQYRQSTISNIVRMQGDFEGLIALLASVVEEGGASAAESLASAVFKSSVDLLEQIAAFCASAPLQEPGLGSPAWLPEVLHGIGDIGSISAALSATDSPGLLATEQISKSLGIR